MLPRRLLRGHRVVGRRRHLQVGVIGHGNMGRGVAASLARAGHDVVVYDADGAQTLRRPSTITAVDSVAAACRRADAVLLSLPHEAAERAVVADLLEARPPLVLNCAEIKILWRVRAESSRRPPRHRRDACSMAWRCRFLTARRSQHGRVIVHPTHWLIHTGARTWLRRSSRCLASSPRGAPSDAESGRGRLCGNQPVCRVHPTILH